VPLEPVINPDTHQPLDMSYCLLRSVSPMHTQYMKNMGTAASMSISIIRGGELWGLIICHNAAPATVPAEVRMACDFLGQILSLQIAAREHAADFECRIRTKSMQTALLSFMAAEDDYLSALAKHPDDLMQLTNARGVALATHAQVTLLGLTPSEPQVRRIMRWLESEVQQTVYATDALGLEMEDGAELTSTAAGMLAVSLSRVRPCYLLWFRPEVVQTVAWGGDPRKPVEEGKADQLSPRSSFELWKETVRDHAEPWQAVEIEAAEDLRSAVVNIVLHNAEEKAELTAELEITNRELESFSYSVSHDLRAPFRHITGFSELLMELEHERLSETGKRYLNAIVESAQYAGLLVDHLLAFSRMNREALTLLPLDMNMLVAKVQRELERETRDRRVRFIIGDLPTVTADLMMMRLVVQNLLSNAVKYTRPREEAVIKVGCRA
jgi:light-regulated signal transduction histidine kinase (bacteriophytochrome)